MHIKYNQKSAPVWLDVLVSFQYHVCSNHTATLQLAHPLLSINTLHYNTPISPNHSLPRPPINIIKLRLTPRKWPSFSSLVLRTFLRLTLVVRNFATIISQFSQLFASRAFLQCSVVSHVDDGVMPAGEVNGH